MPDIAIPTFDRFRAILAQLTSNLFTSTVVHEGPAVISYITHGVKVFEWCPIADSKTLSQTQMVSNTPN